MACETAKAPVVVKKDKASEATITIANTDCAACRERRVHSEDEWKNHPHSGHGLGADGKWTHPELEKGGA